MAGPPDVRIRRPGRSVPRGTAAPPRCLGFQQTRRAPSAQEGARTAHAVEGGCGAIVGSKAGQEAGWASRNRAKVKLSGKFVGYEHAVFRHSLASCGTPSVPVLLLRKKCRIAAAASQLGTLPPCPCTFCAQQIPGSILLLIALPRVSEILPFTWGRYAEPIARYLIRQSVGSH